MALLGTVEQRGNAAWSLAVECLEQMPRSTEDNRAVGGDGCRTMIELGDEKELCGCCWLVHSW